MNNIKINNIIVVISPKFDNILFVLLLDKLNTDSFVVFLNDDGLKLGSTLGFKVGSTLGFKVGSTLGFKVGLKVGF